MSCFFLYWSCQQDLAPDIWWFVNQLCGDEKRVGCAQRTGLQRPEGTKVESRVVFVCKILWAHDMQNTSINPDPFLMPNDCRMCIAASCRIYSPWIKCSVDCQQDVNGLELRDTMPLELINLSATFGMWRLAAALVMQPLARGIGVAATCSAIGRACAALRHGSVESEGSTSKVLYTFDSLGTASTLKSSPRW